MRRTSRVGDDRPLPLTAAQQALWHAQQWDLSVAMNIALYTELPGELDVDLLDRCFQRAGDELDTLFLRFVVVDGEPRQTVDRSLDRSLRIVDLRTRPDPAAAATRWMRADSDVLVDPLGDDLVTGVLLRIGDDRWWWYLRAHHAAMDGLGAIQALRRAAELYSAVLAGQPESPVRPAGMVELLAAEQRYRASPRFDRDRRFWTAALAGATRPTTLSDSAVGPRGVHRLDTELSARTGAALAAAADRTGNSTADLLVAALAGFLLRMTGDDDVFIALPVAARTTAVSRRAAGTCTNTVPLRFRAGSAGEPDTTVGGLASTARGQMVAALRHQLYRHEDIRADTGFGARGIFGPLANVVLVPTDIRIGTTPVRSHVISAGAVEDLTVLFHRIGKDEPIAVALHANSARYRESEARELLAGYLHFLLTFLRADPATRVADLPLPRSIAPGAESAPKVVLPELLPVTDPATIAVTAGGAALDYRELAERSSCWARELIARGLGTEDVVGVALPRSIEGVVAFWAVAKAGCCYLPLDPQQPAARTDRILRDTAPALILTATAWAGRFTARPCLAVDDPIWSASTLTRSGDPIDDRDRPRPIHLDNAAYLITTSGSTGTPRGVVVSHAGLAALQEFLRVSLRVEPDSVIALSHNPAFDASLLELLAAASAPTGLVVIPPELVGGPELRQTLADRRITHWLTTPAVLGTIGDPTGLPALRTVVVGGEACPTGLADLWSARVALIDSYGLTETTVVATQADPAYPGRPPTVGAPLPTVRALVLDRRLRPVPVGAKGELYLGGPGLARGYRQPGDTATRFVADPLRPGQRLYRTGDVVRQRADGTITFVGRSDTQINLHGLRIEPAEIRAAVESAPDVRRALAVVDDVGAAARLIAYVTPVAGRSPEPAAVVAHARRHLPAASVPGAVIVLDDFPLTPNGKIDHRRLPTPDRSTDGGGPPVDFLRRAIATAMAAVVLPDVAGVDRIGVDTDFFQAGGNSLLAVRLTAELAAVTGVRVPLHWIYEEPTVARLAARIAAAPATERRDPLATVLDIRSGGDRDPLICLHSAVPLGWSYLGLSRYLTDRPIVGLQLPADRPDGPLTAESVAEHYLPIVEDLAAGRPCHLFGWSIGGRLAQAIAVRLRRRGRPVGLVTMLDTVVFEGGSCPPMPTMRDLLSHFTGPEATAALAPEIGADEAAHWLRTHGGDADLTADQLTRLHRDYRECTLLAHRGRPERFDGDVLYFSATVGPTTGLDSRMWRPYVTGRLDQVSVPFAHADLSGSAALATIGPQLDTRLRAHEDQMVSGGPI